MYIRHQSTTPTAERTTPFCQTGCWPSTALQASNTTSITAHADHDVCEGRSLGARNKTN